MNQASLQEYMKMGPHVTPPCFCLASTHYAPADVDSPFGRRLGLHLSNDGNQVHWTLDGVVRDTCDITGYFASCPQAVADGAYLTISGVGFQPCTWTIEDLAIYAGP